MPRVTISLTEEEHTALKLLVIVEKKKLLVLLREAVVSYLQEKDAFSLDVSRKDD